MKGLLQRAVKKRTVNNNKPNRNSSDPDKNEIYTEIDRIIKKLHAEASSISTDFSVIKNDTVIPLIVIIGSIVVLIAGSLFFLSFYNSKEKTILTITNKVLSTESKILAAVKAESEEQLGIRDQQIINIKNKLSTAIEDRNRLKEDTEKTLNSREEELRDIMNKTLEAERAKLKEQGLSREDIQKKIAETSNRLEAETRTAMNSFKEQYEQELAEKELAMSIKIEEYQNNLEQSKNEQTRLEDLIEQKEKDMVQKFSEQSIALENQNRSVINQMKEIENINTKEKASLNTDIDILEGKLLAAANNIKSKEEQIQQTDKEREELNRILQKLGDIKKDTNDQEQIMDLLGTKILLKQVLSSEPIKSQYPDLLDQIELYFDVLGDTQKEDGRKAVLTEISNYMESLPSTE